MTTIFTNPNYCGHDIKVTRKYGVYFTYLDGLFYASDDNDSELLETIKMLRKELRDEESGNGTNI